MLLQSTIFILYSRLLWWQKFNVARNHPMLLRPIFTLPSNCRDFNSWVEFTYGTISIVQSFIRPSVIYTDCSCETCMRNEFQVLTNCLHGCNYSFSLDVVWQIWLVTKDTRASLKRTQCRRVRVFTESFIGSAICVSVKNSKREHVLAIWCHRLLLCLSYDRCLVNQDYTHLRHKT